MFAFWDTVIEPVLEIVRPGVVVEVGSESGANTRKLLEFCRRQDATLHAIDPAPAFDVAELAGENGRLIFHQELSLEALPKIERFDAVLLDGDHNWYTVYNELKVIAERCEKSSRSFPLVMLHDIDWPYGRRDLYYAPDTIPEEHRQPYDSKGMLPGSSDLVEGAGMNPGASNAVSEGGPRNGVLTGVEDFLRESDLDLELVRLHGLHGLGILVPRTLKEGRPELAEFLEALRPHPILARHIERLEDERIGAVLARVTDLRDVRGKLREVMSQRERLAERNDALDDRRKALNDRRRKLRIELNEVAAERDGLQKRHREVETRNEKLAAELQEMRDTRAWRLVTAIEGVRSRFKRG